MDDTTLIARVPDVITADLEANVVLMDAAGGHFIELNGTASALWRLVAEPVSLAALCAAVAGAYDVTPETCRMQVEEWADDMHTRGLVTLAASTAAAVA